MCRSSTCVRFFTAPSTCLRRLTAENREAARAGVVNLLERLAAAVERIELSVGEAAVRQGERGEHLFVVAEGELSVIVDEREVDVLERSDVFGESALLEGRPRAATVAARGACLVLRLGREDFLAALDARSASRQRVFDLARERSRPTS